MYFQRAKGCIGLHAELSAALGKRTKHQIQDFAQLHLFTVSSLATDGLYAVEAAATSTAPMNQQRLKSSSAFSQGEKKDNPEGWQHSEWEIGRRLVRETAQGEEAALREILLDDTDGGAQENILFEHGPKFNDSGLRSSALHPLDHCTILALCLDVENSNPKDGLTTEEMFPYVERVLVQAKNWMVHSTALLQRSWLEFDKRRTMDRALLQIQALLDQHTTKLTMFQSSYQCIEESASADERLRYFHGLSYPSQYELKRDLAERYLKCGIFQSALAYFRELVRI